MPLLQKLKSILGLGGSEAEPGERRDVGVTVEREGGQPASATAESAGTTTAASESAGDAAGSEESASETTEPNDEAASEAAAGTDAAATDAPDGGATADESPDDAEATADDAESPDAAADEGGDLEEISGVGPAYAQRLRDAGVTSIADLADADADAIAAETDLSPNRIGDWIEQARKR